MGNIFKIQIVFLYLKIHFVIANSVDLDNMAHCIIIYLCLDYLLKYVFRSHKYGKG